MASDTTNLENVGSADSRRSGLGFSQKELTDFFFFFFGKDSNYFSLKNHAAFVATIQLCCCGVNKAMDCT